MGLKESAEVIAEVTKAAKEGMVEDGINVDIPICVYGIRNDRSAVTFVIKQGDTMEALKMMRLAVQAMSLDYVGMTCESYVAKVEKNPVTDEPWGRDEMQRAAEAYDGVAKGWVSETVMVNVYSREGHTYTIGAEYSVTEDGLVWGDERVHDTTVEGQHAEGFIADAMEQIWNQTTLLQHMKQTMGKERFDRMVEETPAWRQLAFNDFSAIKLAVDNKMCDAFMVQASGDEQQDAYLQELLKGLDRKTKQLSEDELKQMIEEVKTRLEN